MMTCVGSTVARKGQLFQRVNPALLVEVPFRKGWHFLRMVRRYVLRLRVLK